MATSTSRSALLFMERTGIKSTRRICMPRFQPSRQLINSIPLDRSQLNPNIMRDAAGRPIPDHGPTDQWPPAQVVTEVITSG